MKKECNIAPVLMINFNRPDFTERQIASIRRVKPSKVFFAVDGAREGLIEESQRVDKVRNMASSIDWPCEVHTLFQPKNLGCRYAPPAAISWFFDNVESGIILEDDCSVGEDFLLYASELLFRYKDDERIGAISGFNRYNLQTDNSTSYHFCRNLDIWGWATWRRVWKHYENDMASYWNTKEQVVERSFMTPRARWAFLSGVKAVAKGLPTWDYQLDLMIMHYGYLAVAPKERLVCNQGIGDIRGVNTVGYNFDSHHFEKRGHISFPLVHPQIIEADTQMMLMDEKRAFAILPRGLTWLGCKIPSLRFLCDAVGKFLENTMPFLFRL